MNNTNVLAFVLHVYVNTNSILHSPHESERKKETWVESSIKMHESQQSYNQIA